MLQPLRPFCETLLRTPGQQCHLHVLILPPLFRFRFFSYWLLLFLVHSMATSLFRLIGALGRSMVMANTFGSFALMVVFLLGGFILAKRESGGSAPLALTLRNERSLCGALCHLFVWNLGSWFPGSGCCGAGSPCMLIKLVSGASLSESCLHVKVHHTCSLSAAYEASLKRV
jgi:hypothetical protein